MLPFMDTSPMLAKFNAKPAATLDAIDDFQRSEKITLPPEYIDFLCQANGGEGFIGEHYVIFYPVEELAGANRDYEVDEYVKGLFLFGSNGGGEAFAFDYRSPELRVVIVPFIGMAHDTIINKAASFNAFIQALYDSSDLLP